MIYNGKQFWQVGVPNHQISFIWTGRALGDCTAAIITSVVFRSPGLGLLDMSLLVCFILSDGSFANPGRSCLSSRSAFSSQEGSDSLCLSSPASLFFFRLSLELDSSSEATTPPTTPWSSTCSGRTSDFGFLTYFARLLPIQVSSLYSKSPRLHICGIRVKYD